MTTKNQYAMFAVASIAAASFGITPAFAEEFVTEWTDISVSPYDTFKYKKFEVGCGENTVKTELTVAQYSPFGKDIVRVDTDASKCDSHEYSAVTVVIEKNGSTVLGETTNTERVSFTYNGPLDAGDIINVTVVYWD